MKLSLPIILVIVYVVYTQGEIKSGNVNLVVGKGIN